MNIHTKENITILSLLGIATTIGALLTIPGVVAGTDAVDEITITVPPSCSLSSTGGDSHTAEILNGQTNSSVGETTIKAYCNDNNGFSIYAIGYTDNELGKTVLTSSTLGSTHDILTGTNTTGNSSWAMKLSTITSPEPTYPLIIAGSVDDTDKEQGDPDYTSFQEVPDDYTLVAKQTSSTDTGENAEGATLKTTYQVHISNTQSAGTYTGQVKYTMVHPYNHTAPEIPPMGLCPSNDVCMQTQTSASMATKLPNVHSTTTLYDSRDGKAYTVAKLADNKYWMTTNLDIAGGTALSADDTDVTSAYITSFSTSNRLTKENNTIVLPVSATENPSNHYLVDNSQFGTANYSYVFNSGNTTNCGASGQDIPCYSYYSWDAATLGSGRSISTNNIDAQQSICPKNWRLPTSRYSSPFDDTLVPESDFYNLAINYGMPTGAWDQYTTSDFKSLVGPGTTPNFLLVGSYDIYSNPALGSGGYYWSSTSSATYFNVPYAYNLSFGSIVSTASESKKRSGLPVRCLFSGQ